jgi:UDP-2,3-diacylglucosamine hydrolase
MLALLAGAGTLAQEVARAVDGPLLICAPDGTEPEGVQVDLRYRFERLIPFLRELRARGVERAVLAGVVHRPKLEMAAFDLRTAALIPRMLKGMRAGDDATLRAAIALLEEHGIAVVGLAEVAPGVLAQAGAIATRPPSAAERKDAVRAREILDAMAPVDVAQACVVAQGLCLAVEGLYGTDALLDFVALNRKARHPRHGGVLVKRAKRGQDLRVDLPTIGPATVERAIAAGLTGLALQAGASVVLERSEVRRRADAAGLSIWAEA